MTTTIMTRSVLCPTETAPNSPELQQLGDLLSRMVREADARVPDERRTRRTLQEMMPGYQRQPVLTLHRPVMADDACPLCMRWNCDPSNCPPAPVGVGCSIRMAVTA